MPYPDTSMVPMVYNFGQAITMEVHSSRSRDRRVLDALDVCLRKKHPCLSKKEVAEAIQNYWQNVHFYLDVICRG